MDFDEEFQLIQDLADRDFDLVYDTILNSEQPWVGLYAISFDRYQIMIDQSRIRAIMETRFDAIVDAIRDPEQTENILGCLEAYTWFLGDNTVLEAVASVVKKTDFIGQILYNIRHVRNALVYPTLKSAILEALHTKQQPWNIVGTVRDIPNIYNDDRMIEFVVKYIENKELVWKIIVEINDIRSLAEHDMILQAINRGSNAIAEEIITAEVKSRIVEAVVANPELQKNTTIINAIKESIESMEDYVGIIYEVQKDLKLSQDVDIQRAIAAAIIDAPVVDLIKLIECISENRIQIHSQYTREALDTRINEIRDFILICEKPHHVIESIALVHQLVDDERVQNAIEKRTEDIIAGLQEVTPWWSSWYLFGRSIWIQGLFNDFRFRKLAADYIVEEDEVGNITDKMSQMPSLSLDPIFREALLEAIAKFTNPVWLIIAIAEFYNIHQDAEMDGIVRERIPDILLLMEFDSEAEYLARQISYSDYLMEIDEIRSTLLEKIQGRPISWTLLTGIAEDILEHDDVKQVIHDELDDLCKILETNFSNATPEIEGVFRSSVIQESERVRAIIKVNKENLEYELENYWDVWFSISSQSPFMKILDDAAYYQTALDRAKDLAYAIRNRPDGWSILGLISCIPEFFEDPEIIDAIIDRLESKQNPWEIFNCDNLETLLEKDEIMQALQKNIDDLVFGITSTVDAYFIITELEKTGLFKDDKRIIDAIQQYQERFKI